MRRFGVFVPEQDAAWESDFGDQRARYACDARSCKCPDGRTVDEIDTQWELVVCRSCGCHASHVECIDGRESWTCQSCDEIASKYPPPVKNVYKRVLNGKKRKNGDVDVTRFKFKVTGDNLTYRSKSAVDYQVKINNKEL